MDTFIASKNDRHPTDLAALKGARMVCASETEEGRAWSEVRIKQLTGGDRIAARFMRQDFFEFVPQFKLTVIGNNVPELHNVDDAARRRLNIVPFTQKPAGVPLSSGCPPATRSRRSASALEQGRINRRYGRRLVASTLNRRWPA